MCAGIASKEVGSSTVKGAGFSMASNRMLLRLPLQQVGYRVSRGQPAATRILRLAVSGFPNTGSSSGLRTLNAFPPPVCPKMETEVPGPGSGEISPEWNPAGDQEG